MSLRVTVSFSLLFTLLCLISCSSRTEKKSSHTVVTSVYAKTEETKVYDKFKNLEPVNAESLHLKSLDFPYIDGTKHKAFLDSYFQQKSEQNSVMNPANMMEIKSIYFKSLNKYEQDYESYKEKNCSDVKIGDGTNKRFIKELSPQYIKDNKNKIKETIIAVYLKNEKNCKHVNQDLYQRSMLENLTLEIRLIDDMLKFYDNYSGEKNEDLKEDVKGLIALKEACYRYFSLILPSELDEFFFNKYLDQFDGKVIKFLTKNFKGKPFDSIALLRLVKDL